MSELLRLRQVLTDYDKGWEAALDAIAALQPTSDHAELCEEKLHNLRFGLGILVAAMRRTDFLERFPKADEKIEEAASVIQTLVQENARLREAILIDLPACGLGVEQPEGPCYLPGNTEIPPCCLKRKALEKHP